ncbi:uncharacterized protein DUF4191 [Brevibacterium sanguinis]|uniref:Uncharacterized protein DUF4191 n=2 Tax=Brevibacterium TaxID=1696 RepID=A0A366IL13_9MICO|nr:MULTISPECIES: DUF4191 domain-containing protein [Brevibacterium]RBP64762.1 uncharacterized protein DUF4191 [Brevibacterium sanguinis]RBP71595.1 uncharacterized protein DUF4191 [Brevibacterium celere]
MSEEPRKGLFRRKPKDPNRKPGRLAQMRQVYELAAKHNKATPWLLAAAILGCTILGLGVGLVFSGAVFTTILGFMVGLLLAMFMLGRFAETAAFAQMEGQPGAFGAVLNTARRGYLMDEQPIAVDPKSRDLVFRSTGRSGVVLLSEGPKARSAKLLAKEKKRHERILPNVPVHTLQGGNEEGQLTMKQIVPTVHKLPRKLNRAEVLAVRNRLAALGTQASRPPIPKGIDPNKARPNHRAMRGR